MVKNQFYLKLSAALLLAFSAATILTSQIQYSGLIAAVSAISALVIIRISERDSLKTGRTDKMKVALISSSVLYELILFLGAASLSVIPKYAAAIVLASIAFTEILRLETEQELRDTFNPDIAREGRILVLALSLAAYTFNEYFLFYGFLFIALLAIYDSLRLLHKLSREI